MSQFETEDTEETLTCLCITVYHPKQQEKQVFRTLEFCKPLQLRADDVVKFGRDSNICQFNFVDERVSRTQFALHFFRQFGNSEFGFEIKNLSKRVKLVVDNVELAYLNKIELPDICVVRFGDYEMKMERQRGESEDSFNICFELAKQSILPQKPNSLHLPVPESGISCSLLPVEMDEDE